MERAVRHGRLLYQWATLRKPFSSSGATPRRLVAFEDGERLDTPAPFQSLLGDSNSKMPPRTLGHAGLSSVKKIPCHAAIVTDNDSHANRLLIVQWLRWLRQRRNESDEIARSRQIGFKKNADVTRGHRHLAVEYI